MFKEDTKTELKKSLATEDEVLETACAFANTDGGTIYVGIDDSGTPVGLDIGKKTIENVSNLIMSNITPVIYPKIKELLIENKAIISIEINKSEHKPHFYKGRAYKRIGKTNKVLDPLELELLFKRKFLEKSHVDSDVAEATVEDIDEKSIKAFVKIMGKKYSGIEASLKNLGLMKEGTITNAAVLFFGKEPTKFFPLYGIKCGLFKGNEVEDMSDFTTNIFQVVDSVINYIVDKIPKKLFFDKARRYEKPLIPEEVLREALVNALIHRDYTVASSIFVRITTSEIEIKNPGMLPEPLEVDDLYKPHDSRLRNPLIAELAHKAKMIEHWASGTLRMISSMRSAGLLDPVFSQDKGFFRVILHFEEISINDRQKMIIEHLKAAKQATFSNILAIVEIPERTLRRDVSTLLKHNMIYATKKGRQVIYSLIK